MAAQPHRTDQPFYVADNRPKLHLVDVGPREYYTTKENIWEWTKGGRKFRVVLYAGFNTDIASIPGLFGLSKLLGFTPDGPWRRAAVLHDFLYRTLKLYKGVVNPKEGRYEIEIDGEWVLAISQWKRKEADDLFLHFMLLDNVPAWKAKIMHRAVRTFGGVHMRMTA